MKRMIFCALILLGMLTSASAADGFVISGTLQNGEGRLIKLDQRMKGQWITIDSAVVEDGAYRLEGKVDHPIMTYLKFIEGDDIQYINLFVENTAMIVRSDMEDVDQSTVEGSASHDLQAEFEAGQNEIAAPYDTLYSLLKSTDNSYIKKALQLSIKKVEKKEVEYIKDFILSHTESQVAAYAAYRQLAYWMDYTELKPLVEALSPTLEGTAYVASMEETLEKIKHLAIGNPAPVFEEKDSTGALFSSTSLQGKYVLLDFWASWCGPCREENPNVVAMYKDLGGDDFEILGISLDKRKENWLKAIADDGLEWYHVSDLQGWNSAVADLFSVKAIPQTYLLDREGNIVAKNLRGDELREKVEELLSGH